MDPEERTLIGPDETAFRLELTPVQLRLTHTALKSLLDGFGRDNREIHDIIREVLAKLPPEHDLPDLKGELRRRREAA